MPKFELIQCTAQMRPTRRYDRDGTYEMINVQTYESGPDARAFDAALHKRWVDSEGKINHTTVADAMGITGSELEELLKGIYTIANWPEAHQLLRELPVAKKKKYVAPKVEKLAEKPADFADDE